MISYEQALREIEKLPFRPSVEEVGLLESNGRYLAEDIRAPWPLPRFDNSAMDGFAHHPIEKSAIPATLKIVGESSAGTAFSGSVSPGEAIRISTGAKVPKGITAITPIEECEVDGERLTIKKAFPGDKFVRQAGTDTAEGSLLYSKSTGINPGRLSMLASYNIEKVTVYTKPKVAIIATGNEVKELGQHLGETDIVGSSIYYLQEELRDGGCETRFFGIAGDEEGAFFDLMKNALQWADIILTTAGVSVGKHDVVGDVVKRLGGDIKFWKLSIRPGKPTLLATYGDVVHFGFPGNPVSTCCNVEVLLKGYLRRWIGLPASCETKSYPLANAVQPDRMRLWFVYGIIEGDKFVPLENQRSSNLSLIGDADYLGLIEPGDSQVEEGTSIQTIPLQSAW